MRNLGLATFVLLCSSCSLFVTLVFLFSLSVSVNLMGELTHFVTTEMITFKNDIDRSWSHLRDLRLKFDFVHQQVERENMFNSIFRPKRRSPFDVLPSWCQCEPLQLICPPGPPGPPGRMGRKGVRGNSGRRGKDNFEVYEPITCPIRNRGCILCPSGPSGLPGFSGGQGKSGRRGSPGIPGGGYRAVGRTGPRGTVGDVGAPGRTGSQGRRGPKESRTQQLWESGVSPDPGFCRMAWRKGKIRTTGAGWSGRSCWICRSEGT